MRIKNLLVSVFFIAFCQLVFSQKQQAKKIPYPESPDSIIGFLEFKPKDYGTQLHPLIIFLHGTGERGNGSTDIQRLAVTGIPKYCAAGAPMRFMYKKKASTFVVLSPQLSRQYGAWQVFYVEEMIKYAKGHLKIDTNRIYITGLSLGGGGVWSAITTSPELTGSFAAAAPVCGTQEMKDPDFSRTVGANHLPVWAFHSMDDAVVPVQTTQHAEILANINKQTPALKITYYKNGGHAGAWNNAYNTGHIVTKISNDSLFTAKPNLYEWFLSHTRLNNQQFDEVKNGTK